MTGFPIGITICKSQPLKIIIKGCQKGSCTLIRSLSIQNYSSRNLENSRSMVDACNLLLALAMQSSRNYFIIKVEYSQERSRTYSQPISNFCKTLRKIQFDEYSLSKYVSIMFAAEPSYCKVCKVLIPQLLQHLKEVLRCLFG